MGKIFLYIIIKYIEKIRDINIFIRIVKNIEKNYDINSIFEYDNTLFVKRWCIITIKMLNIEGISIIW